MSIKENALKYRELGWSVIPLKPKDKMPFGPWKHYQKQLASQEEISSWFRVDENINIGIATGTLSGIVVIDVEAGGDISKYPKTVMSKTGGEGFHVYFKHPGVPIPNSVKKIAELTDVKGDGGIVTAPPSIHPNGNAYSWVHSPFDTEMADLPNWIIEKINAPVEKVARAKTTGPIPEGSRNDEGAREIGRRLKQVSIDKWGTVAWPKFQDWNRRTCQPPLTEPELRQIFDSICQSEIQQQGDLPPLKSDCSPIIVMVLDLIKDEFEATSFLDQLNFPMIRFRNGDHYEVRYLKGERFHTWVSQKYYKEFNKALKKDQIGDVINILIAEAYDKPRITLADRVSYDKDSFWYDLSNEEWSAVKINKEGWSIVNPDKSLFYRHGHEESQKTPIQGGDARKILDFVNIGKQEDKNLLLVTLISYFIPGIPHPAIVLYGPQGSAKSSLCRIIKTICDPSLLGISDIPHERSSLIQQLAHNWLTIFDNVSWIKPHISDMFCRVITGGGFSKRELFTIDEDVIYNVRHCIGINSINMVAIRPDLLDRSVLIGLERILEEKRKPEAELWKEIDEATPAILGGIFDVISKAIEIKETIKLPNIPRMADFATWGCAIAEALGTGQDSFLSAYMNNINSQNEVVIYEDIVGELLLGFITKEADKWSGQASILHSELKSWAEKKSISTQKGSGFPPSAGSLMRRINNMKTNLEAIGLHINSDSRKYLTIEYSPTTENTDDHDIHAIIDELEEPVIDGEWGAFS